MSANREDAMTGQRGPPLPFESSVLPGRDPTEDLADEITSELGATPKLAPPAPFAPDAPRAGPPAAGTVLRDRYVVETPLGAGGTATVYRATDLRRDGDAAEGRHVALKVLRPELRDRPQAIARLQREFRQLQAAAHAGVVRVFDLDCDRGAWFIVMELLSGESLGSALQRAAPSGLPAGEALRIAGAAGDALAHAHAAGVVHGDVKPDNIFLTDAGGLRLLDFGVAPGSTGEAGPAVPAAATRAYASPEVLAGSMPGPRDDVFSLACVTYEMLAGTHPYGRRGSDRAAGAGSAPLRIESLDDARWKSLEAALSFSGDGRPDMAEFMRALGDEGTRAVPPAAPAAPTSAPEPAVVAPQEEQAATLPQPATLPPAPRRSRLPLLAAFAAVLALILGILIGRLRAPQVIAAPPPSALDYPEPGLLAPPEPAQAAAGDERQAEVVAPPTAPVAGPPGLVFFDSPRMIVSRHAVVAAIPMRNLGKARRSVTVNWRILEGGARLDRDFGGPVSGAESFVEGNSFRILYVPILQDPGATQDRRFTVEMTAVSAGTELGPTPRVEVTILGGA